MSAAGDVWSLGMTLVETLTQNLPVVRTAEQQDPLFRGRCRSLFLRLRVTVCFVQPQSRWTVAQIAARLEGRAPIPQTQAVSPEVRTPLPAVQPISPRASRPPCESTYSYTMLIAVGSRACVGRNSGRGRKLVAPPCRYSTSSPSRRTSNSRSFHLQPEQVAPSSQGTSNQAVQAERC